MKAGFAINAKNKSTIGTLSHIGFSVYDCWALAVPSKKKTKKKMVIKVRIENEYKSPNRNCRNRYSSKSEN